MQEVVEITRQWLFDTGGWKEMKPARALHAAGRVSNVKYENGFLTGQVVDGGKTFSARLEIRSRTDVINHCTCFRAKRDGIICAHVLACGLELIEPTKKSPTTTTATAKHEVTERIALSSDWPSFTEISDTDALPIQLHLVVAPNLTKAWDSGKITLGIEAAWEDSETHEAKRQLFSKLAGTPKLFVDTADAAVLSWLQTISPESVPGMLKVNAAEFTSLADLTAGHTRITLGKKAPLFFSPSPFRPLVERLKGFRFGAELPAEIIPLPSSKGLWAYDEKQHTLSAISPELPSHLQTLFTGSLSLSELSFRQDYESLVAFTRLAQETLAEPPVIAHLDIEGSLNHLDAVLSFEYPHGIFPATDERSQAALDENDAIILHDTKGETRALETLLAAGFQRKGASGTFVLKDKDAILQFLAFDYPELSQNWQTQTGERFEHAISQVQPVEPSFTINQSSGSDWFALDLDYQAGGTRIPRAEVRQLLEKGQSSKRQSSNHIAVLRASTIAEIESTIADCAPEQPEPDLFSIDHQHRAFLQETAHDLGIPVKNKSARHEDTAEELSFYPLSEDLEATLRPYQKAGVAWMQSIATQGQGGILADDMGLGKTLQTLSFLYSLGGQALIICPSSLVDNWAAEAERFTPDLPVAKIVGSRREEKRLNALSSASILITSYAVFRRDAEFYRALHFDAVIIDEAQSIKNPDAAISKAVHNISGTHRFALTGTPVENSVRDLWSICQFVSPGYLGGRKEFAERFEKPLSSTNGAPEAEARLNRRLRPLLLRRLKTEVAKELPPKVEQVLYCDLSKEQRQVYNQILEESKAQIIDAEGGRQRMLALTALLRLRQASCDLRLLGLQEMEEEEASIKGRALDGLLTSAIEGGHRVLVFSQFVEMLQILVPQLASRGIDFCYLDGSTKNRQQIVDRFQSEEIPVFLISLKAGGVGLNLTAADTVVHIDPWWNPAVEAQATDRAYRIGQTRTVNSYKLIARGTVEEKILALQERKKRVSDSLISLSGESGLSESELLDLFE